MSTQDEDASKGSTSYQFFSHDSYTNYFTDQSTNDASSNSSASASSFSSTPNTPSLNFPPTSPVAVAGYSGLLQGPDLAPDVVQVESSIMTASAAQKVQNPVGSAPLVVAPLVVAPVIVAPVVVAPPVVAPVVQQPVKPYSLKDIEPEPTFEERVAAMKQAAAEKAMQAQQAQRFAPPPATIVVSANPEPVNSATSIPNSTPAQDGWNTFPQVQLFSSPASDKFSSEFNFNRSLLKIFWRIDVDHNNRVSRKELAEALTENWFDGDDRVLATILFDSYEDISPDTIFCDAGLSVNNILSYAPFAELANISIPWDCDDEKPVVSKASNERAKKPSQSLRSLFNKR